jgi:hypothetical protein
VEIRRRFATRGRGKKSAKNLYPHAITNTRTIYFYVYSDAVRVCVTLSLKLSLSLSLSLGIDVFFQSLSTFYPIVPRHRRHRYRTNLQYKRILFIYKYTYGAVLQ